MIYSAPSLSLDLISYSVAEQAYRGTSFYSEKRAKQAQIQFCNALQADWGIIQSWSTDPVAPYFKRHLGYCAGLYNTWLNARSRCISTMIAGSSNFPVRRAEKANRSEHNRWEDFEAGRAKSLKRIKKELMPYGDGSTIYTDDPDALKKLTKKLNKLVDVHSNMKKANLILRSDNGVESKLEKLGFSVALINKAKEAHKGHGAAFPAYALTNSLANIKQTKQRIEDLEKASKAESLDGVIFCGGVVTVDRTVNRIKIDYTEKPDEETRTKLKKKAFKWSPKNGVWQRQITNNAICDTEFLLNVDLKEAYI